MIGGTPKFTVDHKFTTRSVRVGRAAVGRGSEILMYVMHAAMVAKVGGVFGTLRYPHLANTTVFSVLWPPSIAGWGSLVFPYTLVVH